jgi:hypothetical protein
MPSIVLHLHCRDRGMRWGCREGREGIRSHHAWAHEMRRGEDGIRTGGHAPHRL